MHSASNYQANCKSTKKDEKSRIKGEHQFNPERCVASQKLSFQVSQFNLRFQQVILSDRMQHLEL